MKILAVLTYYYPHWTGLTTHAVRVAEGLAKRGHQVTVLTVRHSAELPACEMVNGVRVVRLRPVGQFSRGMIAPAFPLAAARLIAAHDVVQIHTPLPEALLVGLLCRALGRPLLMTHHGDVVMPAGIINRSVQGAAAVLLWLTARLADRVTSYSGDYARHSRLLRGLAGGKGASGGQGSGAASGRPKLACVYPPVEMPEPDARAAEAWRGELKLSDRLVIGFAGRWVEEKGFDYLLKALPLVREVYPEAHLLYAGERRVVYERFYERCRPLIEAQREHVTMLGLIRDPQQMANFYEMCDLFVLPSRTDMMAMVQIEAMLCGTPVVASDIPGARVVVRETGFGRLAPPHDHRALAREIVEALRDRHVYRPSREAVREVFDTEQTLRQYEDLMSELVGGGIRSVGGHPQTPGREAPAPLLGSKERVGGHPQAPGREAPAPLAHPWASLDANDHAALDRILRNEADMAYRRRARILLDYLDLRDGERVLDCGCGMGFYLMAMGRLRSLRLVGLDSDLNRLRMGRGAGVPGALVGGDVHRLPFADGAFDKVLMSEVLEHVPDEGRALREVYRVLRPGGILAMSVPHANYPFWWDPINRVWTGIGGKPVRSGPLVGIWTNHERLYRPAELVGRVEEAGFSVEVAEEATHYSFPFIHFIVYGIGKPLVERGLLPAGLRTSADRFGGEQSTGNPLNPINAGLAVFDAIDRLNERPGVAGKETFVNVLIKARKP